MSNFAVRVGQEGSPVQPNDPIIGSDDASVYQAGQFAPSIDELASVTISEAAKANLLTRNLPIFDDEGNVTEDKLLKWMPADNFKRLGINSSSTVPKHSLAVLLTVADFIPGIFTTLNTTTVMAGQASSGMGDPVITSYVSTQHRIFRSGMMIYPDFYKYITTPLIPAIPGIRNGISMATYATVHSIGHIMYSKLVFDSDLHLLGEFMDTSGWTKKDDSYLAKGSYLGKPSHTVWRRDASMGSVSEIAKYGPAEDFADSFAQFCFNRTYLDRVFPEKYDAMQKVFARYNLLQED